jgi:formate transporter
MAAGSTKPDNRGIDALLPAEIAEKAEAVGVQKTKLDTSSLLALAVLAITHADAGCVV